MPRKARSVKGGKSSPSLPELEPQPTLTNGESNSSGASSGRARNGQFTKGNSFGPWNPHARHCARMLALFRSCVTENDIVAIIRAMVDKAAQGDSAAVKIVFSYVMGKPETAPNPDQIDRDEWEHYQRDTINLEEMQKVLGSLPTKVGNDIARTALPIMTEARTRELETQLRKGCPISRKVVESTEDADEQSQNAQPLSNGDLTDANTNQSTTNHSRASNGATNSPPLPIGNSTDAIPTNRSTKASRSSTLSDSARTSTSSRPRVGKSVSGQRRSTADKRRKSRKNRKRAKALRLRS